MDNLSSLWLHDRQGHACQREQASLVHDVVLEEDNWSVICLALFTHFQEAPLKVFTGSAGSFKDVQHHQRVAVGAVQHILELLRCRPQFAGSSIHLAAFRSYQKCYYDCGYYSTNYSVCRADGELHALGPVALHMWDPTALLPAFQMHLGNTCRNSLLSKRCNTSS